MILITGHRALRRGAAIRAWVERTLVAIRCVAAAARTWSAEDLTRAASRFWRCLADVWGISWDAQQDRLARRATCLLVVTWLGLSGCSSPTQAPSLQERTTGDSVVVEVNSKAPAFATRTLDGGTARLADYVGSHVVLLEFWSIFCKSCIEEMPHIEALYDAYAAEGLAVLSVNTDVFSPQKILSFMEKAGIRSPYPILRDPRQEVAGAFGVELLPVTVIVDREGWIRLYQEGYRPGDEKGFERAVRRWLGGGGDRDVTLAPRDGVTNFAPGGSPLATAGQRFDQLRARSLAGAEVRVGGGRPLVAYFWSLYCSPCREEFPRVVELAERYRTQNLAAAAINVDAAALAKRVASFVAPHGGLDCVLDSAAGEEGSWAQALGVRATPTLVLFDGAGSIAYVVSGHVDLQTLDGEIQRLLREGVSEVRASELDGG